jgi:hypothetical protein
MESGSSGTSSDSSTSLPWISLPKGGGFIAGMGEKFKVNAVDGAGSATIPISITPGRGGITPSLSLGYNSGSGNGPFGLGWSLSEASITRKTSKGLPQYDDARDSDVFLLGGAEDLVPLFRQNEHGETLSDHDTGLPIIHEESRDGFIVRRHCPRIEGNFIRIERWTKISSREAHWRVTTPDNVTSIYGADKNSQICDPLRETDQESRVFSWLLAEQYDSRGNAIIYEYKEEDSQGVSSDDVNERNRTHMTRSSNRYLKTINMATRLQIGTQNPGIPFLHSSCPKANGCSLSSWTMENCMMSTQPLPAVGHGIAEKMPFHLTALALKFVHIGFARGSLCFIASPRNYPWNSTWFRQQTLPMIYKHP